MNPHPSSHLLSTKATSRRQFLRQSGCGFGTVALHWLLGADAGLLASNSPYLPKPAGFIPKAQRIIHICALGGVSHVDAFDYKPELDRRNDQTYTGNAMKTHRLKPGRLMGSPYTFKRRGRSGLWMSDLLPHLAECVDDLTFVHSMHTKNSNHTPATFQMNCGMDRNGYPNFGAWASYGLGSENQNLPAYIVLPDPRQYPAGGAINWTSGFLPAVHQGVAFQSGPNPIADLNTPSTVNPSARTSASKLLTRMNKNFAGQFEGDSTLEARIHAYELAAQMQMSVPELTDLKGESESTRKLYGLDSPVCGEFGRNCLLARRLAERGVRFVQIYNGGGQGSPRVNWDAHEDLTSNHDKQAAVMDQPVAALLKDLKLRGMLEDTLVLWTTEFGRTPITEGLESRGRDHHKHAFTIWMAGAGVKKGYAYGATDELGNQVVQHPTEFYDIHATSLHLMGMDHTQLTYYHNGIARRLTNVHGNVIHSLFN
ncbi:MAG: DUF1501 domain-containing protein [Verrucomicrobiota bacterium]|jgi:hypothetical protein